MRLEARGCQVGGHNWDGGKGEEGAGVFILLKQRVKKSFQQFILNRRERTNVVGGLVVKT